MATRIRATIEFDITDLPDDVREFCKDMETKMEDDEDMEMEDDAIPTVADMDDGEQQQAISVFFDGLNDYDMQQELWAGSGMFCWFSNFNVVSTDKN